VRLLRRSKKPSSEGSAGAKPGSEGTPKPSPAKPRPGLAETFRIAWAPPRARRAAGGTAVSGTAATAAPSTGTGRAQAGRAGTVGRPVGEPGLLQQREELARQFAELQWDLGGIAYEMATRKQFKGEVILKQAEKLREVDAKLGQIERVLRLGEEGAAGTCPNCGALQARGAVFCWKCGKQVSTAAKAEGDAKGSGNAKPSSGEAETAAKPATGKPDSAAKPESK
jgi:uncharacterized Zn finger protein (UPF0148 family)